MERLTLRDDDGRALLTPYGLRIYCSTQATADCICKLEEALQAQEPRVLTLDELEGWDGVFMIESRAADGLVWASWYATYENCGEKVCRMLDIDAEVDDRRSSAYGRLWRCWTSRPTDAQREAEPWGEP